ncbi:hypothetical protein GC173_05995 [bacterium]|nr:hypothetical protein [bacterium]
MRVMVMVKASAGSEAGVPPTKELMEEMGKFNEELVKAGIMQSGDGLKPSSQGVRIRFSGKDRTLINGPFTETKELVAGYWLWEVKSMEEAIEWVKRCPNPMMEEESDIEIRPFYEVEDFAQWDPSGKFVKEEEGLRDIIALQNAATSPYLFFGGCCEEAIEFYKKALGARVEMVLRFDQSPDPIPAGMLPAGFEKKIMHASLRIGKLVVMASDGCNDVSNFSGFRLSLTVKGVSEANLAFNALAEGGKVDMPLMKTFWSPLYGQVTDKFGLGWMVMVEGETAPDGGCK